MVDKKQVKSEIVVQLSDKISIQKNGEQLYSNKITLKAASAATISKICALKQIVMSAFKKASVDNNAKRVDVADDSDLKMSDSEQLLTVLYMHASADDMVCVMDDFCDLLIAGCGLVEDVVITNYVLNQFLASDLEMLLGEYIVNFMLPSWMRQAMKN
jgi:hypothetical protein